MRLRAARAIPLRRSPSPCQSFAFGPDQVGRRQSPGTVETANLGIRIEGDGISDFQFLDEIDGVLLAVFDSHRKNHKVLILILLIKLSPSPASLRGTGRTSWPRNSEEQICRESFFREIFFPSGVARSKSGVGALSFIGCMIGMAFL